MVYIGCLFFGLLLSVSAQSDDSFSDDPFNEVGILYGVFEDGNKMIDPADFEAMILDLQARDLNAIAFTSTTPDLTIADRLGMNIIATPMGDLFDPWYFNDSVSVDLETAREIIAPVIAELQGHPSVRGYNLLDDATPAYIDKLRLTLEVIREIDPITPASPVMVRNRQGLEVYEGVRPDAFLTYYNPIRNFNDFCDFYGQETRGWVDIIRMTNYIRTRETPLWLVLQAHSTVTGPGDQNPGHLREPIIEEVRLLNWMALGEEAEGIFWFVYSTFDNRPWRGLKDNPELFAEITELAGRVRVMEPVLLDTDKIADRFFAASAGETYTSSLYSPRSGAYYVLAANQSCDTQDLTITTPYFTGMLRDVETDETYPLGAPISFRGGDGRLFQLIDAERVTTPPDYQPNLVLNPSFEERDDPEETDTDFATDWRPTGEVIVAEGISRAGADGMHALRLGGESGRVSQFLALEPDTRYYLSYWVKAENLDEGFVGMSYVQSNAPVTVYFESFWNQSGSYDWTKRVAYFRTSPEITEGRLDVNWVFNPDATAWLDDIVLCEAEKPCEDSYLLEFSPPLDD